MLKINPANLNKRSESKLQEYISSHDLLDLEFPS